MPWERGNRKARLPPNWTSIRRRVLERDQGRCTWRLPDGTRCQASATDVDHIDADDDDRLHKLASLCHHHHAEKSRREAAAALARRRADARHRPEPHPGA